MATAFRYRSILVGVDFSAPSRMALARARDLAERLGARLEVVHVVERLKPALPFSSKNRETVRGLQREIAERARERLTHFVGSSGASVRTRVLTGVADRALLAYAERSRADLVVLANRGHSALEELLIGSTAERVLRHAQLPVLLVSAPPRDTK